MKALSEKQAIEKLRILKDEFRREIVDRFEHRAKSCATCETKGACCLDAHFVNVHVSRLEAVAIGRKLATIDPGLLTKIKQRITNTIAEYKLDEAIDTFAATYACPLFERGIGCTVHDVKPAACIAHACYERPEDLPPDELLDDVEAEIARLDRMTYGSDQAWHSIPVALCPPHEPVD